MRGARPRQKADHAGGACVNAGLAPEHMPQSPQRGRVLSQCTLQVLYSSHNSFAELQGVMKELAPREVVPVSACCNLNLAESSRVAFSTWPRTQVVASNAAPKDCIDPAHHFKHLLSPSTTEAVLARAPPRPAAAQALLFRALGQHPAANAGGALAQTGGWQAQLLAS